MLATVNEKVFPLGGVRRYGLSLGTGGRGSPRCKPAGPARPKDSSSPLSSMLGGFAELRPAPFPRPVALPGAVDVASPDSHVPAGGASLSVWSVAAAGTNGASQGPCGALVSEPRLSGQGGGGSCRKVPTG